MLKPDPMRYSRAVPTRFGGPDTRGPDSSGPEWIEPDTADNEMVEPPSTLGFYHEEELPADLALDLRLHEILEHALRATAASGAVVALASGDEMVCRATAGEKAPSTGVFLNTRSGLSGLCVQTGEMQRCDDALADYRVNADACRLLDIRSIVVLPILEGTRLWGIIEIFSSSPHAFSDADVQALQVLGRRVSHTVQEAVEGGTWTRGADTWTVQPKAEPDHSTLTPAEALAREIVASSLPSSRRRDYRTSALTVAVIALAVLLGWMVGRVGWSMAVNRAQRESPIVPEETQAQVQVTPQTAPPAVVVDVPAAKPSSPAPVPPPASASVPKSKVPAEPAGGLVVYEQGKVVFRMAPSSKPSHPGSDSATVQKALTREGEAGTGADLGSSGPGSPESGSPERGSPDASSPSATNNYLLERFEPEYPEQAKERRIQGPVVLNALVGTDGAVRELKVISGDPMLVKAATDAVRRWRFQPHRLKARLVEFETRITVTFTLP